MILLQAENITMEFGGLRAVDNFNLSIKKDELVGLIGPNGAGKTTVFNMLTGVYKPTHGDIKIAGKSIVGKKPYQIVESGAARTFQNIRLFKDLTVLENILIAYHNQMSYGTLSSLLRLPSFHKGEKEAKKACMDFLDIFDMKPYADTLAKNLPYGKQRKLEIARALATDPKILLLDEPAAGMNPQETQELMETIRFIRKKFDIAILLIEHDMNLVMNVCERIVVLDYGQIIAKGTPEQTRQNPDVIRVYLGEQVKTC
jgi:branched-chain amino acid transport system ATP-binding protein